MSRTGWPASPGGEPRPRRGVSCRTGLGAGAAALSVFAIAGASAGIATVATSHHSDARGRATGRQHRPPRCRGSPSPTAPSKSTAARPGALRGGQRDVGCRADRPPSFNQGSLTGSGSSLYAFSDSSLVRIDPATGSHPPDDPVQPAGPTGRSSWRTRCGWCGLQRRQDRLRGSTPDARPGHDGAVPAFGGVSTGPGRAGGGPTAALVAAGCTWRSWTRQRPGDHRINLTASPASSVAVSPDGSKLYVGVGSFQLLVYDLAAGSAGVVVHDVARRGEPGRDLGRRLGHDRERHERVGLVRSGR